MSKHLDLLSLSILILSIGITSAFVVIGSIGLLEMGLIVIAIMGIWMIILSLIQVTEEGKISFITFSSGLILIIGGIMGFLYSRNIYASYLIPAILILIGIIGVIAAFRFKK